ncbi:NADPH:quinone oxidoreductase family protein [Pseudonocardia nigra]|uniref:NADPH:quinone oxidoreductase family protein n=1 Tax=Pseudonocardia nigra TaxID=1921578 RepID=UPI001C5DD0EB|nr:NADPH:quinone oxidoreductase family protein [Pseudonocardia nigra]
MRAAFVETFGPPESLVTGELPDPVAGPGEVLIEVAAAGVNFPDILVVAGTYQILPERPFSPGKEVAGTVRAVGNGVDRFAVGDRVLAQVEHGGYAELVAVPEPQVVALPDGVPFVDAAAFGLGAITAHFALVRRANLQPGEIVLVTGAGGGVGSAAVQIAKALGASVIAAAQDEQRATLAKEQGADQVVLAGPSMRDDVMALTDGRGVNVVLELVGGDVFAQSLRSTAWEGRLVVIGFASGDLPSVKAGHILVKNLAVLGLQVSDYRDREPEAVRAAIEHMLQLYLEGRLTVPVARTFPLEEAGAALAAVQAGSVPGKVVLTCRPAADVTALA